MGETYYIKSRSQHSWSPPLYTPHHEPRRELPKPLTASSSHLCHCGQWYRGFIHKTYHEGIRPINRSWKGFQLSRPTPNGNETDWDAADITKLGSLRPYPVTYDGTDKKLGGGVEMGLPRQTASTKKWVASSLTRLMRRST